MKTEVTLPDGYVPFGLLKVCSNTLKNGRIPISISGDQPFLVGRGKKPRVWVNQLALNEVGKTKPLVRDNLTLHPQISVDELDNEVVIKADNEVLIHVVKVTDDEAHIIKLDLRTIGIQIYGDQSELHVVNQTLSNNEFVNVDCMIGVNVG
ncbi:hypothetical protein [Shewanella sp. KCT]|uniref:hypothetical protein n=1 Tax=Shewanella sp. KCT TaxID=2569535 RepID=UPI0011842229|nr:hypothetical protein [Shewanella sp. KCT]TVP12696.1 hypothetical protein AYI87_13450 [Shewanella sp. KCT]